MRPAPYDVVIVGAGSAGSVLAARLTEDPGRRVLVLEAGATPRRPAALPEDARDGTTVAASVPGSPIGWTYLASLTDQEAALSANMPAREYKVVRGKLLGGSGAINGGYFIRPRPADHALWATRGGERWSAGAALPLLRAMESDLDYGETAVHGGSGPIPVRRSGNDPVSAAFTAAAAAAGHQREPDKNAGEAAGVGPVPQNVVDGVRRGPGTQYLLPVLGRSNLTVRGGAIVRRIAVRGARAVGVEVDGPRGRELIRAGEIVVAAGAIETPHLLLLSGIGHAAELREHGIRSVADLPVGRELSDHASVTLAIAPKRHGDAGHDKSAAGSPFCTALHLRAPSGEPIELLLGVRTLSDILPSLDAPHALPLMVNLPATSRGALALRSANADEPPAISYGYLATVHDREIARYGVRAAAALIRSPEFGSVSAGDDAPDAAVLAEDDALDRWLFARIGTTVHTCGTAPMGPVADGEGRVHGVTDLRIADTSLLPRAPERGPAASAVLVGEIIARAMQAEPQRGTTQEPFDAPARASAEGPGPDRPLCEL